MLCRARPFEEYFKEIEQADRFLMLSRLKEITSLYFIGM